MDGSSGDCTYRRHRGRQAGMQGRRPASITSLGAEAGSSRPGADAGRRTWRLAEVGGGQANRQVVETKRRWSSGDETIVRLPATLFPFPISLGRLVTECFPAQIKTETSAVMGPPRHGPLGSAEVAIRQSRRCLPHARAPQTNLRTDGASR